MDRRDTQAALTKAGQPGGVGRVVLPPGLLEVDAPLVVPQGVWLTGAGSHNARFQAGTTITPADGYGGPLVICGKPEGHPRPSLWHHGGAQHLRVEGSHSHGLIAHGMGENSLIDQVAAYANAGDGIRIRTVPGGSGGTPVMVGRVSTHGNAGSGVRLVAQTHTHVQVLYLAGDNNGEALFTIDGYQESANAAVLGWKAERWGEEPGHARQVFLIRNGNGGVLHLGPGRVLVTVPTESGSAIVRQVAAEGSNVGYVDMAGVGMQGHGAAYEFVYSDDKHGHRIPIAEGLRRRVSTLRPDLNVYPYAT